MKAILLFETVHFERFKAVLNELLITNEKIFCVIRSGYYEEYELLYHNVCFIDMRRGLCGNDGLKILEQQKFHEIYILSATPYFYMMNKELVLISKLNYQYLIFLNCYNQKKIVKKHSSFYRIIYWFFCYFISKLWKIMHKMKH